MAQMEKRKTHGALAATALLAACAAPPPLPPSLYDEDPALAALIDANDAIDGTALRVAAFVNGESVRYWHLGERGDVPMPVYQPCTDDAGECVPTEHPLVAGAVPGEEGYSPYGRVHLVHVPAGWTGRLRSVEEVEAALASGEAQEELTTRYVHCPIAAAEAELEVGTDATVRPERPIWVHGLEAGCFDIGRERALLDDARMWTRHVYLLTREGESAPLHEGARMADLTGDGDQRDTNNVFGAGPRDGDYTPLWKLVLVTVPADYRSIDTSMDETVADYRSAGDMFDVAPDYTLTRIEARVIDHEITDTLIDCPIQLTDGRL
jgi:hypothetical protein